MSEEKEQTFEVTEYQPVPGSRKVKGKASKVKEKSSVDGLINQKRLALNNDLASITRIKKRIVKIRKEIKALEQVRKIELG